MFAIKEKRKQIESKTKVKVAKRKQFESKTQICPPSAITTQTIAITLPNVYT